MEYDFSGYATKHGIKCSDGRTINQGAFKNQNGTRVPLVWQHLHNDPGNVLGHADLEYRPDGVYAYAKFNNSIAGKNSKELVMHGDVKSLSIYANQLVQKGGDVLHGVIREVSLVLSGANPGALIDNLSFQHGDSTEIVDDEAIIYNDSEIIHDSGSTEIKDIKEPEVSHLAHEEKTVQDVFNSLSEEQKNVVYYMIGQALESADEVQQSDDDGEYLVHNNIFENGPDGGSGQTFLSHSQVEDIFSAAQRYGSLKESVLAHAVTYGIENIDLLFPDAKAVRNSPDFISRRMGWVSKVLGGTHHTPFSRIKSMTADITEDTARAKGYIKGNMKKEEFFKLAKRVTTPQTIYKKQKLDRDDIIDITDLDVVAWIKAEMRLMLDEEIARAVLIGDGREITDPDKISEDNVRPIVSDADLYSHHITVSPTAPATSVTNEEFIEAIIRARNVYKGSGTPTLFTTAEFATDLLLSKDKQGRRLYRSMDELASDLRVESVVEVEVMEGFTRTVGGATHNVHGILVNLKDYSIGADKGGEVSMFDDFDIDYNQYKYLIETRLSGALTLPKSAVVIETVARVTEGL